jgi:hypothetical protein
VVSLPVSKGLSGIILEIVVFFSNWS